MRFACTLLVDRGGIEPLTSAVQTRRRKTQKTHQTQPGRPQLRALKGTGRVRSTDLSAASHA